MIGTLKKTNQILTKYNLRAKKGFGQNFLIDENILKKIIQVSELTKDDGVIEIGPGIGALTEHLCLNAKKVLAFEIDSNMLEVLGNELKDYSNLKIINQDFLEAKLENLDYFNDCKRIKVVSNLPYYITTPIITKLLGINFVEEMYLMVQKEVGMRLSGKPKTKDYNSLSVFMAYKSKCKIEFTVARNCFLPAPNVDSVIISVKKIKSDFTVNNEAHFLKFIQIIFAQRRKTTINNIANGYSLSKEEISLLLENLGYLPSVRSEELTLEDIYKIYMEIFKLTK
ncbi:MAG: 16S rRNA (adenine(1518)-N(6)/adenine(1519)-N(6))-dimethyltransferase RsmA [Bacilli bacterium]|nr:16S rRNA (adenine(1518)-N(6)/adenine(1519)-N(6))-dimethyltransferase RsmA [Bacilli bacterium]